jgi:hypothetical protein
MNSKKEYYLLSAYPPGDYRCTQEYTQRLLVLLNKLKIRQITHSTVFFYAHYAMKLHASSSN